MSGKLISESFTRNYFFKPNIFFEFYLIRRALYAAIHSHAQALSGRLMDFGCGSKPYKPLFNVAEYIGVDYASEGHPHINEQIDIFYDGNTLPFQDHHFDSVFSSEVFEHVFNLPEILLEIHRVLKPGGKILITCPFNWNLHEEPNDFARYTPYALKSILEKAGFEILVQERTGNFILCINQMKLVYIYTHLASRITNRWLRRLFLMIVSAPVNLWAMVWSRILPVGKDLYFNNVVLAIKKTP